MGKNNFFKNNNPYDPLSATALININDIDVRGISWDAKTVVTTKNHLSRQGSKSGKYSRQVGLTSQQNPIKGVQVASKPS